MLRKDLDDLDENGQVGDWCFVEGTDRQYLFLRYPINDDEWAKWYGFSREEAPEFNRGDIVSLPISGDNTKPVWQWDGNREAPTLSPSINVIGRWHGWLQAGKLVTA
jgi:hypothetical protein